MKDFDDFERWFSENCVDDYEKLQAEIESRALDGASAADAAGNLIRLYPDFRLRKYHEWLTGQMGES